MRAFVKFSTVFLSLILIYSATWFVTQQFAPPEHLKPKTMIDYTPLGSIKDFPEERMIVESGSHSEAKSINIEAADSFKSNSTKPKNQQVGNRLKRHDAQKNSAASRPVSPIVSSDQSQQNIFDVGDPISRYLHNK